MTASTRLLLFTGVVFLAQWLVPLSMIQGREKVLSQGTEVKFEVTPIDPYDPFRGRYVRINARPLISEDIDWPDGLKRGARAFALLEIDSRGFAQSSRIVAQQPESGLYLTGKVPHPSSRTLDFDLDRYYMNEAMAPATEELVRGQFQGESVVHVSVRVLDGQAVITGLFVDGIPVEALVAKGD